MAVGWSSARVEPGRNDNSVDDGRHQHTPVEGRSAGQEALEAVDPPAARQRGQVAGRRGRDRLPAEASAQAGRRSEVRRTRGPGGRFPGEGHLVPQPGVVLRVEPAEAGSVDAHIPGVVARLVRFPEGQVRDCEKGRSPAGIIFGPVACLVFLFLPPVRGFRLPPRWSVRDGFRRGLFHHDFQQAHEGRLL